MGKKRLGLHSVAIFSIVIFGFLAISSTATTRNRTGDVVDSEETILSSTTDSKGLVYHMPSPGGKPFVVIDLVFAVSVTEFDENGLEISSQEGIVTMLLKEAQKLGGHDILNIRIDENVVATQVTITEQKAATSNAPSSTRKKIVTRRTVTYTGSALAIKYLE